MRRLISLLVLLAFVAALSAPAIAACRMRAVADDCCCPPAPADSWCAPDCCAAVKAGRAVVQLATHARGLGWLSPPSLVAVAAAAAGPAPVVRPSSRAFVGLHERAAPRVPLRI